MRRNCSILILTSLICEAHTKAGCCEIESANVPFLSNNINRYLLRAVEKDVAANDELAFVYTKFCRFGLFGIIDDPRGYFRNGTKVRVRSGRFEPSRYTMHFAILKYLNFRAEKMNRALDGISEVQQNKIDENVKANIDKFAASEQFRAMRRDMEMFGREAVIRSNRSTKNEI